MKVTVLCMMTLLGSVLGELPPPETSYKILMLLPVSSKSHKNVFMPVAEALANRGHKITMLTNHPKSSNHANITEVQHGLRHFREDELNMFEVRKNPVGPAIFTEGLPKMARDLYTVPQVKDLYNRRKEFDLIIVNAMFNEAAYPFVHEVPFIMISTGLLMPNILSTQGNVPNTAYYPSILFDMPSPMSAWHRFLNTITYIGHASFWRLFKIVPAVQKEISNHFPDLPPLLDIERNLSLVLFNSHFSIDLTQPLLPSQVSIGAMHCRPSKPLPKDLESWISGAGPEGVIYFSLGSITRGNSMPVEYRNAFIEAFRRLPHRVIWKYEGELEGVPDNVLINKWLPQQDILGHDKVKVFITHGGFLSLQEAVYHATPLLSIPIFGDQPKNGRFVRDSGIGRMLVWEEMTVDDIVESLTDITTDSKYKENILGMSRPLRDQLTTPHERAIFWTEYVIRHQGAPQLRCPATQLSWVEFFMLDVLFYIHVTIFALVYIMKRLCKLIYGKLFGSPAAKKKRD